MRQENTGRDPFFDNVKFILILLMVFGHFAFENRQNPIMMALCNTIYSFHMPLFILVSGYFSKSIVSQRKSDITMLILPYLILEAIHYVFTKISGLGKGHLQFYFPTYQNWYILSLFFWRLLVPYYKFIPKTYGIILVFVIALGAGSINHFGEFLSLLRTFYLMPFFVVGYYFNDIKALVVKLNSFRILFILLFLIFAAGLFTFSYYSTANGDDLFYAFIPNYGYVNLIKDFGLRSFALLSGLIMSFLFLFVVPKRKTIFSNAGKNTMTVFMFHIFLVWPINKYLVPYTPYITEIICIALSIGITALLSSKIAEKLFKSFTDPMGFLDQFKKDKEDVKV